MRLATRLKIATTGAVTALIALVSIFVWSLIEYTDARTDYDLATEIKTSFFERSSLRDQYFLHHEDHLREKWDRNKEMSDALLRRADVLVHDLEDRANLALLRNNIDATATIFHRIVNNHARMKTSGDNFLVLAELDSRLSSQLLLKAAQVLNAVTAIQDAATTRADRTFRRLGVILGFFAIALSAGVIINSVQIGRILRRRLAPLHTGAGIVAGGNLEHRIDDLGADEFAELAQSINAMTRALQISTWRLEAEICERTLTETMLRGSEYRSSAIIQASPVPMAMNDAQGNITFLNHAFLQVVGYALTDIPTLADWWPRAYPDPQYRQQVADGWQKNLDEANRTGKPFAPIEVKIRCKDNSVRIFMVSSAPLEEKFAGNHLVIFYDITKGTQTEAALRENAFRWQFAIEGAGDGLWDWNMTDSTVFFSPRWKSMLGFTEDEIGNGLDEWSKRVHPDDLAQAMRDVQAHVDGTTPIYLNEHRVRCKDGSWKFIHDRGLVVERDGTGKAVRMIGTHRDITERKQMAGALARTSELLEHTGDLAKIGGWEVNLETKKFTATRQTFRITEVEPSAENSLEKGINLFAPDARATIRAAVQAAIDTGTAYDLELPLITAKGRSLWVHTKGFAEMRDGKAVRLFGTMQDITQSKIADAEWRKLSRAMEQSPASVVVTNAAGLIDYVNPRFEQVTGYSRAEVIGANPRILKSGLTPAETHKELWATIVAGKEWRGELCNRRKNGELYWESAAISSVLDKNGNIEFYVAVKEDITERRRAEQALIESEGRFRNMADSAPVLIWHSGLDKLCTYFNKVWLDFTGRSIDQEMGNGWVEGVHPEDLQRCLDTYVTAFDARQAFKIEYRLRRFDGEYRWLVDNGIPRYDYQGGFVGYIGSCFDIHDSKQSNAERDRLLKIIEEAPDFIATSDMQGRLTFLNNAGARMVGLPPGVDPASLEIKDMHPPWGAKLVLEEGIAAVLQKGFWRHENALLHSDGREISVAQMLLVHRDAEGNPEILSTIIRDITERKAADRALIEAREAAESANRAKSEFLANMSHEIRTPLNGLMGNAQLLEMSALGKDEKEYAAAIMLSGHNLLELINDILDLSKIEAEKVVLEHAQFSLRGCINNVIRTQRLRIVNKGLVLNLQIEPEVPDLLIGDELRVKQILLNLLGNAIKFTHEGSITVSVSIAEQDASKALLNIAVTDTGIGIAEADMRNLFKPFMQADSTITRRYGGSGLGLAISWRLAELMGGSIGVDSTVGVGSTFRVRLPFPVSHQGAPEMRLPVSLAPTRWTGPMLKVLLAEDNSINQQFGVALLKKLGHQVTLAENGEAALAALAATPFDLLLMDIQMPGISGQATLDRLRAHERETGAVAHLPVIALTAYVLKGDAQKYQTAGFDGYVSKPMEVTKLIEEMRRVLGLGGFA